MAPFFGSLAANVVPGREVLVSVPESASRMAFETYIQRAGLEEATL